MLSVKAVHTQPHSLIVNYYYPTYHISGHMSRFFRLNSPGIMKNSLNENVL